MYNKVVFDIENVFLIFIGDDDCGCRIYILMTIKSQRIYNIESIVKTFSNNLYPGILRRVYWREINANKISTERRI